MQTLYSLRDQMVQMSTIIHSSFNQFCVSHKTISHQAAVAPGPEVDCEYTPLLNFKLRPGLLATNPDDAHWL